MNLAAFYNSISSRELVERAGSLLGVGALVALCCYPVLVHRFGPTATAENKMFVALIELFFILGSAVATRGQWVWPSLISKRTAALFFLFLVAVALSTIFSIRPAVSVVRTAEWIVHLLFAFAVFNFFRARDAEAGIVPAVVGLAFLSYTGIFLLEYFFSLNDPSVSWTWITPGFSNIRHLGYFLAFVLPMVTYGWIAQAERPASLKVFSFGAACLAWMLIFEIGGRGPVFAVAASLLVLPFLVGSKTLRLRILSFTLLTCTAGAILSLAFLDIGFGLERLLSAFERETLNDLSSNRLRTWAVTLRLIAPTVLFGTGPDSYMFLDKGFMMWTVHPHGLHIQVLADWGLMGGVLLVAVLASFLVDIGRPLKEAPQPCMGLTLVSLWTVMILLVFSSFDGVLYHAFPSALFFLSGGVFLASRLPARLDARQRVLGTLDRALVFAACLFSILVMGAHGLSLNAVASEPPTSPAEMKARFFRLFPSALTDYDARYVLYSWVQGWVEVDPWQRAEWYDWIDANARPTLRDPQRI